MSIGPLLPGRLPNAFASTRITTHLERANAHLALLQDQISTGQRFLTPGEAPADGIAAIALQSRLERQSQLQSNVVTDRRFLSVTEGALAGVSDALNEAISLARAGIGDASPGNEKLGLAEEAGSLLRSVLSIANTSFGGRFLFAGTDTSTRPFEIADSGAIRYLGNDREVNSALGSGLYVANNVDGFTAFGSPAASTSGDLDAALSLGTRLADLNGGTGVETGLIEITLTDGVTPQTATVDLTSAESLDDVKTRIENAFSAGPITITVDIDPASQNGLRLTPSTGTVEVTEVNGGRMAAELGIASSPSAAINGVDLDPVLTLSTSLASLNNGTGIGPTAGTGLHIVNGTTTSTIDLDSLTTIEDLFNAVQTADPDLIARITDTGDGIEIASRLSGVEFSIGENGGQNATLLGLRTLTASTSLDELNLGIGLPDPLPEVEIRLSDGTELDLDFSSAQTVQDVLDIANAAAPGSLSASLNAIGNGITLADLSGAGGNFTIVENPTSTALGIAGQVAGGGPPTEIVGEDVHPREAEGVLNLLAKLETSLRAGDDGETGRILERLEPEANRLNLVRGDIGNRLRLIDRSEDRLQDEEIFLRETLSEVLDADFTEVVTQLTSTQATLQATLQVAAQTLQLSLFNFV